MWFSHLFKHHNGSIVNIVQDSVTIADGFDNNIVSYTISYSDSTTGNVCSQPVTIPASNCPGGTCKHVFQISTSFCHPATNITVSVTTVSLLGAELTSDPITIGKNYNVIDFPLHTMNFSTFAKKVPGS